MSKILELRTKRNTLWEQTKDFLEKHRGDNGLVKAEAVEQYNKMAQEVKDLGAEIERLEQQAQIEAQLSAPTSNPVHADPKNGSKKDVKPTATAEYAENFWNMIRNRGHYGEVRNALSVGEDTEGGFTVPDEFEKKLVEALEENNIFRGMATVIRTSSGTRKIPIAEDTGEASWIDEGEEIPESDATFGQTMPSTSPPILHAGSVCVWAMRRSVPSSPVTVLVSLWACWLKPAAQRSVSRLPSRMLSPLMRSSSCTTH